MITNSKVFHLYLSTIITGPTSNLVVPLNSTNLNNVSWQVDWNSLFRGWNKQYKRCCVRYQLISTSFTATSTDWENYNGVLCCNLPSDAGSSTNFGTALGLYSPLDCPTTGTTTHCILSNTLANVQGVDILMPQSNSIFTITWLKPSGSMALNSNTLYDYEILLQFELSEPIPESIVF